MASEPQIDVTALLQDFARRADTSYVIVSGSILEDWLKGALETKMRKLNSTLEDRLFSGYGPLSTFSAKIDMAYALEIISAETFNDLRAIKDLRNEFAHSKKMLHFKSPELEKHFQKMTGWAKGADAISLFNQRINACVADLKDHLQTYWLVDALKNYKPDSSPDKSG